MDAWLTEGPFPGRRVAIIAPRVEPNARPTLDMRNAEPLPTVNPIAYLCHGPTDRADLQEALVTSSTCSETTLPHSAMSGRR